MIDSARMKELAERCTAEARIWPNSPLERLLVPVAALLSELAGAQRVKLQRLKIGWCEIDDDDINQDGEYATALILPEKP